MSNVSDFFSFDRDTNTWNLGDNVSGFDCSPVVNGQELSLKAADRIEINVSEKDGERQVEVAAGFDNPQVDVSLVFKPCADKPATEIEMFISNPGTEPLTISDSHIFVLDGESEFDLGNDLDKMVVFRFRDTLGDNFMKRITDDEGVHNSVQLCHISHPDTGKVFFAGNLTFNKMYSNCELSYNNESSRVDSLKFKMLFNDFVLQPGNTVSSEKIYVEVADDGPYRVLEEWAKMVNSIYKPNLPEQSSAGWAGWAWVDGFKTELPESLTQRNVDAISKRLAGFGIKYIWISISNLEGGLPGNWLVPNKTFYPNGLKNTLEDIKQHGFKPGFWIAPFYMCEGAETFDENLANMFKDKDGKQIPRYGWLWAANAKDDALPNLYYLDPSHPDTEKFLRGIFAEYRKMGLRYYMLDFLNAGRGFPNALPHDPAYVSPWEAYRKCMKAIREETGPDTHLLTAVGSTLAHIGTVSASRIGMDYGEGRQLMPRFPSYPANYIINGSYGSAGSPNRNAINNMAYWYFAHRNFFLCDSNLLTVDKPIPRNEAEISATLFGTSGGPVILGDDIDTISDERLAMVKKCLPRGNSAPFPATMFSNLDKDDDSQVFVVTVEKPWGKWFVVSIFNINKEFKTFELDAGKLKMESGKQYRMFDFWRENYCGVFENSTTVDVPANSAAVFRFEEVKDHPWILSTDMHVRQGEAELTAVKWDEENFVLSGKVTRPAGETGNLYLVTPWNWKPRNFNKGLFVAKSGIDESLIIRKEIKFESDVESWEIGFEHFTEEEVFWRKKNKEKFRE